jgi:hypothetical protein
VRWYEALVIALAAGAALGAWVAAWATRRAAAAHIVFEMLNEYARPEMSEALERLKSWRAQHGDEFASDWELAMAKGEPDASLVDHARRRVLAYFRNADELWQKRLISSSTARAAVDRPGLAVLIHVCAPLERRVNPRVSLRFVRRLRTLCRHRRDLMVQIPSGPLE